MVAVKVHDSSIYDMVAIKLFKFFTDVMIAVKLQMMQLSFLICFTDFWVAVKLPDSV